MEDKDKTGCYYTFTKDYELNELRTFPFIIIIIIFLPSRSFQGDDDKGLRIPRIKACLLVSQNAHCISRSWAWVCSHLLCELTMMMNRYSSNHKSKSIYLSFDITHSTNPTLQSLLSDHPVKAVSNEWNPFNPLNPFNPFNPFNPLRYELIISLFIQPRLGRFLRISVCVSTLQRNMQWFLILNAMSIS